MGSFATSKDGTKIYYERSGAGRTALLFVHGWMGNSRWWDVQRDFFSPRYTIVQMDLGGHGKSGDRARPSAEAYAEDILAVARAVGAERLVLVGHSMSGAYVTAAAPQLQSTRLVVLVDTLKNLDELSTPEQMEQVVYRHYRKDFAHAVKNLLPQFLFARGTPEAVKARLVGEFLRVSAEKAIGLLAPLYEMDVRAAAKKVTVPVRAIDSDFSPTNREANRKYFRDYDFVSMAGTGHYPMLERPGEFNGLLEGILRENFSSN